MIYRLTHACEERNYPWIVGYLTGRYEVYVTPEEVAGFFRGRDPKWARGTYVNVDMCWDLWLRVRIDQLQGWPKIGYQEPPEVRILTKLHVFFLSLEETELQLALLHNEIRIEEIRPARSRFFRTNLYPHPINILAENVSGLRKVPKHQEG